jgi:hypothetical protein
MSKRLIALTLLAPFFVPTPGTSRGDSEPPPLNAKVLKAAEAKLSKQVGDGECWSFVDATLAAVRAHRPNQGGYGRFVFGRELKRGEGVLPGDIVQFTGARFVSKNGGRAEAPQHTAIVTVVDGTTYSLLHQNWGGVRRVVRSRLDLAEMTAGRATFFRPQPAPR